MSSPTPERGSFSREFHDTALPTDVESLASFVQKLKEESSTPEIFFQNLVRVDFDEIFRTMRSATSSDDDRAYRIQNRKEVVAFDQKEREYVVKFVSECLIDNVSLIMAEGVLDSPTEEDFDDGSFGRDLRKLLDTIWMNRGKEEDALQYPERVRCGQLQRIRDIVFEVARPLSPFDPKEGRNFYVYLENQGYGDAIPPLSDIDKVAQVARNIHGWYRTLAYLTPYFEKDDFAILLSEAISNMFRPRWKAKDNPDVQKRYKKLQEVAATTIQEWVDVVPEKQ